MGNSLRDWVNRGRLFEVEPGFADILGYEMVMTAHAYRSDMNRMGFGNVFTIPVKSQLGDSIKYFVPADQKELFDHLPKCHHARDLDDTYLGCNLDEGHRGPHYDATFKIEWSHR